MFVNHQMPSITRLTRRCIWIHHGRIETEGQTPEVLRAYLTRSEGELDPKGFADLTAVPRRITGQPRDLAFCSIALSDEHGNTTDLFFERQLMRLELMLTSKIRTTIRELRFNVTSADGSPVFACCNNNPMEVGPGTYGIVATMQPPLVPGTYNVSLQATTVEIQDTVYNALSFRVELAPGTSHVSRKAVNYGVVRIDNDWTPLQHFGSTRSPINQP